MWHGHEDFVGRKLKKAFCSGLYEGTVKSYDSNAQFFRILYEDGDEEDLDVNELESLLLPSAAKAAPSTTVAKAGPFAAAAKVAPSAAKAAPSAAMAEAGPFAAAKAGAATTAAKAAPTTLAAKAAPSGATPALTAAKRKLACAESESIDLDATTDEQPAAAPMDASTDEGTSRRSSRIRANMETAREADDFRKIFKQTDESSARPKAKAAKKGNGAKPNSRKGDFFLTPQQKAEQAEREKREADELQVGGYSPQPTAL